MKIEIKGVIDTGDNRMSNAAWITAFTEWLSLNGWKSEYLLMENHNLREETFREQAKNQSVRDNGAAL